MPKTAPILFTAFWISLASVATGAATGAVAFAQQADPNFLASLDSGLWQFRTMDGGAAAGVSDRICISDTKKLAQIRHLKLQCSQKLLKSNAASMVISYSCAGHGHGMTTIRKETSRLIHVDTQGISDGSPFAFSLEARRLDDCP